MDETVRSTKTTGFKIQKRSSRDVVVHNIHRKTPVPKYLT